MRKTRLAKITRPRLHAACPRDRLFDLFDAQSDRPVVWIAGPPGAGKTTVVASYCESRATATIWYQMDAADGDPAALFQYLRLAITESGFGSRPRLPALAPEHLRDLPGFSRRFFRAFFASIPNGGIAVFDNFQELPETAISHALICAALEDVPRSMRAFIVSRADPSTRLSRAMTSGAIALVGWDQLRLDPRETSAIARNLGVESAEELEQLHDSADGWAAGVTLLAQRGARVVDGTRHTSRQAVFDYFAGEVFDRSDATVRQLWLRTAVLPRFTIEQARTLSGVRDAGSLLDTLHRRHLFVERREGVKVVYLYHSLFSDFLQRRAMAVLPHREWNRLVLRAARLLEDSNQSDDAMKLYLDVSAWDRATSLALRSAPTLLAQGRGATLRQWLADLPPSQWEAHPECSYWVGTSLIHADPVEARRLLADGYMTFVEGGDVPGQIGALAGIVEATFFEYRDFRTLEPWIPVFEALLECAPAFPSVEAELRAYSSMLVACSYPLLGHRRYEHYLERIERLLEAEIGVNQRVMTATFLLIARGTVLGRLDEAAAIMERVRPLLRDPVLLAPNRIAWLWRFGYVQFQLGAHDVAVAAYAEARSVAEREGLRFPAGSCGYFTTRVAQARRDWKGARAALLDLDRQLLPNPIDRAFSASAQSIQALHEGDHAAASRGAEHAISLVADTGFRWIQVLTRVPLILALVGCKAFECARRVVDDIRQIGGDHYARLGCELELLDAYCALAAGERPRALEGIGRALLRARESRYRYFFADLPEWLPLLFDVALRAEMEVPYVRTVVREHRLLAPATAGDKWPWRVKVWALGPFRVEHDDTSLVSDGRAQKKPLELLRALIAAGARSVPSWQLMAALWPDSDGDAAQHAFETTLYRLRKLMDCEEALILFEGALTLNARVCWVDAWAFDACLETDNWDNGADLAHAGSERALELYRGKLLSTEEGPWALAPRDHLHRRYLDTVDRVGGCYEAAGRWSDAMILYERALSIDDLAELAYRGLIRCHLRCGEPGEALRVFRRCRELLSIVLGVPPSTATLDLHARIHGAGGSRAR